MVIQMLEEQEQRELERKAKKGFEGYAQKLIDHKNEIKEKAKNATIGFTAFMLQQYDDKQKEIEKLCKKVGTYLMIWVIEEKARNDKEQLELDAKFEMEMKIVAHSIGKYVRKTIKKKERDDDKSSDSSDSSDSDSSTSKSKSSNSDKGE